MKLWVFGFIALAGIVPGVISKIYSGDEAFFRIEYESALSMYDSALSESPNDAEILWRLARTHVCLGEVLTPEKGVVHFALAEKFARRCIALDSTSSEGYTWLSAALGYVAFHASTTEQVRLSQELDACLTNALRLNVENDAALSIRGSFYRALGNIGWLRRSIASVFIGTIPPGGFEEAERDLLKAVSLAPTIMRHRYELGVLYLDLERSTQARESLEIARNLPIKVAIDKRRIVTIDSLLHAIGSE